MFTQAKVKHKKKYFSINLHRNENGKKTGKKKKIQKKRRRRGKGRGRAASCKSSWNNWILGGDELESELSFLRLFVQSPR